LAGGVSVGGENYQTSPGLRPPLMKITSRRAGVDLNGYLRFIGPNGGRDDTALHFFLIKYD